MKKEICIALTAVLLMASAPVSFAAETESETETRQDIVILATSDVHCGIDENFA